MSSDQVSCEWVLDSIELLIDGDLSRQESAAFEEHVAGCSACAEELEFARGVVTSLRALERHACPSGVSTRAEAAARAAAATSLRARLAGWFAPHADVLRRPAMMAMMVLVVAAGIFVVTQRAGLERSGSGEFSQADIEAAARDARAAFAYIGRYSRRTGRLLRDDVIGNRVIPPMQRAMVDSRKEVVNERIVPVVERAVMDALFVETIERIRKPNQ